MSILVNIDVPDLDRATTFYTEAFGLHVGRRLGREAVELLGWPTPVYLLRKAAGTIGAGADARSYDRHWTPVHLDVVADDIEAALVRARAAGAIVEKDVQTAAWGRLALLADPFGHGFCLVEFTNRGYDALVEAEGEAGSNSATTEHRA